MSHTPYTNWRKSTRSGGDDNCVEVATADRSIGVRDSKNRTGAILEFSAESWTSFVAGIKAGDFDTK